MLWEQWSMHLDRAEQVMQLDKPHVLQREVQERRWEIAGEVQRESISILRSKGVGSLSGRIVNQRDEMIDLINERYHIKTVPSNLDLSEFI